MIYQIVINNRHHIQISLKILVKNINSSHNWKSPGGDQIHNFWLKKFTCIHKCLLDHFNGFIREPNIQGDLRGIMSPTE
jgi:hypothetical protein